MEETCCLPSPPVCRHHQSAVRRLRPSPPACCLSSPPVNARLVIRHCQSATHSQSHRSLAARCHHLSVRILSPPFIACYLPPPPPHHHQFAQSRHRSFASHSHRPSLGCPRSSPVTAEDRGRRFSSTNFWRWRRFA